MLDLFIQNFDYETRIDNVVNKIRRYFTDENETLNQLKVSDLDRYNMIIELFEEELYLQILRKELYESDCEDVFYYYNTDIDRTRINVDDETSFDTFTEHIYSEYKLHKKLELDYYDDFLDNISLVDKNQIIYTDTIREYYF